jgi:hypothetical protein
LPSTGKLPNTGLLLAIGTGAEASHLELGAAIAEALAKLVLHNNRINLLDSNREVGLEDGEVLKVGEDQQP